MWPVLLHHPHFLKQYIHAQQIRWIYINKLNEVCYGEEFVQLMFDSDTAIVANLN